MKVSIHLLKGSRKQEMTSTLLKIFQGRNTQIFHWIVPPTFEMLSTLMNTGLVVSDYIL